MARKDTLKKLLSWKKPVQTIQASALEPILDQATLGIKKPNTIDAYPLNEPHAYARIVRDPIRGNITYMVEEPESARTIFCSLGA